MLRDGRCQIELAVRRMRSAVWSNAIRDDNIIKFNELGVGKMFSALGGGGWLLEWFRKNLSKQFLA